MERDARKALEARMEANRKLARHQNVAGAEGFVTTARGKRFFREGSPQKRRGK